MEITPEINPRDQIFPSPLRGNKMRATTLDAFIHWAQQPGRRYPLLIHIKNAAPAVLTSANDLGQEPSVFKGAIERDGYVGFEESAD